MQIPDEVVQQVVEVAPELLVLPGVVGLSIGLLEEDGEVRDELAVRVLVSDALDAPNGLPTEVAGIPVCVIEFPVEPLFDPDTTRYPEIPGGAQIQQAPLASGTLGAIAQDGDGRLLALSCHHVVGDVGSTIWQPVAPQVIAPNPPDLTDAIGRVEGVDSPITQTIPVPVGPVLVLGREVDAATVSLDPDLLGLRTGSDTIADGFGTVAASRSPEVGTYVRKRGSQSGPTTGLVVAFVPFVSWRYGTPPPGHAYMMVSQYEVLSNRVGSPDGIFSRGGDSGSLVLLDNEQTAVGLLWGGVPAGGIRGVMCDITTVESRLGITVAWSGL